MGIQTVSDLSFMCFDINAQQAPETGILVLLCNFYGIDQDYRKVIPVEDIVFVYIPKQDPATNIQISPVECLLQYSITFFSVTLLQPQG